ncbi:MAG: hypothetical protein M3R07_06790 [Gemmatimonadota bacterium]|nr:hypothetical protein [Gemmatimonadota bacterium]
MTKLRSVLLLGTLVSLAACGADDVASPGEGSFAPGPPGGTPPPPPPPPPPPSSGPAPSCPALTTDRGVIANKRNCEISGTITGTRVIQNLPGTIYSLAGRVQVGTDMGGDPSNPLPGSVAGQLNIDPGVTIFGSGGLDFLIVNRGSQIIAEGTQNNPIIFTSRQNIEGTATDTSIGQFGGLVILGRAPIQRCNQPNVPGGSVNCQSQVEGTTGLYGGATANDNSGRIRYVQVRFPGFEVSPGNELNGITLAGVGSGTTMDHVQVHNSSDDGFEWFGGTVNARYLVVTGADDDSLDTDFGYKGANQFIIVNQRSNGGDRIVEADTPGNGNSTPRSYPKFANMTAVSRRSADALLLRGGTDFALLNSVVTGAPICLDIDEAVTVQGANATLDEQGPPIFRSVFFSCPTAFRDEADVPAAQIAAIFNGNNNVANGTSTLQSIFVNGPNESGVVATNPTSISAFFQNVPYIGAVRDQNDLWFLGWTCGLGFGTPSCTSVPNS